MLDHKVVKQFNELVQDQGNFLGGPEAVPHDFFGMITSPLTMEIESWHLSTQCGAPER